MNKCVFLKASGKPCGTFISAKKDICDKCKRIADSRKAEAARQEKLKADPEKKKEFEQKRLNAQRARNETDPSNYKSLPFPMPRKVRLLYFSQISLS